jgi:hypothetical protein
MIAEATTVSLFETELLVLFEVFVVFVVLPLLMAMVGMGVGVAVDPQADMTNANTTMMIK